MFAQLRTGLTSIVHSFRHLGRVLNVYRLIVTVFAGCPKEALCGTGMLDSAFGLLDNHAANKRALSVHHFRGY